MLDLLSALALFFSSPTEDRTAPEEGLKSSIGREGEPKGLVVVDVEESAVLLKMLAVFVGAVKIDEALLDAPIVPKILAVFDEPNEDCGAANGVLVGLA